MWLVHNFTWLAILLCLRAASSGHLLTIEVDLLMLNFLRIISQIIKGCEVIVCWLCPLGDDIYVHIVHLC